jgi:hypothetical protein
MKYLDCKEFLALFYVKTVIPGSPDIEIIEVAEVISKTKEKSCIDFMLQAHR